MFSLKSANNDFTELTFVYEENERCHEFRIAMSEQVSLNLDFNFV
jgi:hypothetical protein